MKKQPNPNLRNTAIYVGNDAELRKRAIDYYEANGFRYNKPVINYDYISTFRDNDSFTTLPFVLEDKKIITLPEPEPKYPCMMMVSDNNDVWVEVLVICKFKDIFIAQSVENKACFHSWKFAKPITTTTITTEALIEYYEKNTNTKVRLI